MEQRRGAVMDMQAVTMEVIGAIALIILLSMLFIYFFGSEPECFGNTACMEARDELQHLVDDVNTVCQQSDITEGNGFTVLNEEGYDFSNADRLAVSTGSAPGDWYTNTFTLEVADFQIQETADECSQAKFCQEIASIDVCDAWYVEGLSESTVFSYNLGDNPGAIVLTIGQ